MSGDAAQVSDPRLVKLVERVEHRTNEDIAAGVRLLHPCMPLDRAVADARRPSCRSCPTHCESRPGARRLSELQRDRSERTRLTEIAPHRRNLLPQHVARPKVLKQRHEIGKRLVERHHVGLAPGLNPMFIPISRACVSSWAMTSCDRAENTIMPGNGDVSDAKVAETDCRHQDSRRRSQFL